MMAELPAEILNLGPTAGVIVVVWAFLRYLTQQREAAAQEAARERESLRETLHDIAASHERALNGVSTRVERLSDTQAALAKAIEAALPSSNS